MVDTGKQQAAIRNNSDRSVVIVDALAWYAGTVLIHLPETAKDADLGHVPLLVGTADTKGRLRMIAIEAAVTEKAMEAIREFGLSVKKIRINLEDCVMRHHNGAKPTTFFQISNHPTGETLWIENSVQDERSRVKVFVASEQDHLPADGYHRSGRAVLRTRCQSN